MAVFLVKFSSTILKQCPLHFNNTQTFRLHARNKTYLWEISFLNLAQQTSSIFPHLNVKTAISTSILLLTVRKNPVKKKNNNNNIFWRFHVEVKWKTSLASLPWAWIFPSMVNLSHESPVTRTTPISRCKRVIYHGKSVPCNRTYYWMSSRSLYSDDVFLLFISFYTYNTEHPGLSCTQYTHLSNAIQQNSHLHQNIPRKRNHQAYYT